MNTTEKMDIERFNRNKDVDEYCFTEYDGTKVRQIKATDYYWEESIKPHDVFQLYREFYLNGNIKRKGIQYYNGNFQKGVWTSYDEEGRVTESVDYDIPFKNCPWEYILQYTRDRKINLYHESTNIDRYIDEETKKPVWDIRWSTVGKGLADTSVRIDGENRKVLWEVPLSYIE